jgi:hypothetical protein
VAVVCCTAIFAPPAHAGPLLIVSVHVPGTSDPWLAGMPDGTSASQTDMAPGQSPARVPALINPGTFVSFVVSGEVTNGPCCPLRPPDGFGSKAHVGGAENGISDIVAPHNALVGVFLADAEPHLSLAPSGLDFITMGIDFVTLAPELKQVFFIGDGMTTGGVQQQFLAPLGASRLFLGTMDGYEWTNNLGSYSVDVGMTPVPEPSSLLLMGTALAGLCARRFRLRV